LGEYEKRVLRIFGPKSKEVQETGEHYITKNFINFYSSPDVRVIKSRRIGWVGHVLHMRKIRNAYRILVRKPEGKRPLGRPRHIWEYNTGVGRCGLDASGSG